MKNGPRQKLSQPQLEKLKKVCLLLTGAGLLWLLFFPGGGLVTLFRQRSDLKLLEVETAELTKQNSNLRDEVERLEEDPEYLEKVARRDFGLLKKNERVYDFAKPEKQDKE